MLMRILESVIALSALAILTSCGGGGKIVDHKGHPGPHEHGKGAEAPENPSVASKHSSAGHTHQAQHGGIVQTIGDYHVELVHDPINGEIAAYVLGNDEKTALPIEARLLEAQVKPDGEDQFVKVDMNPIPLKGEAKGKSSRFAGTEARLKGAKTSFEAVLRIPIGGKIHRAAFQVVPGAQPKVYVCPMDCENSKAYYQPGNCPVCKMALSEPTGAHADHSPKHGGVFFMAPNNWHHLEGVMPNEREFRLYVYNNFTKPISPKQFLEGSSLEITNLDANNVEIGGNAKVTLSAAHDDSHLVAIMPANIRFPVSVRARIKLGGKDRPDLFDFTFEGPSVGPSYPLDTCIVSDEKLGSMGNPIVYSYLGRTIKFCCEGCVKKFENNTAAYLKKLDGAIKR